MPARLLLVEDDELIREGLELALTDEGFDVVCAGSGEDALELLEAITVDVALLDLRLPGIDGLTVCRTLRDSGDDLPIIVITARTDTRDVIAGVEAGADDYVGKPLVASELAARIRALLRRSGVARPAWITIRGLEIRPDDESVHRDGRAVHLIRTEFRLLAELAAADGSNPKAHVPRKP